MKENFKFFILMGLFLFCFSSWSKDCPSFAGKWFAIDDETGVFIYLSLQQNACSGIVATGCTISSGGRFRTLDWQLDTQGQRVFDGEVHGAEGILESYLLTYFKGQSFHYSYEYFRSDEGTLVQASRGSLKILDENTMVHRYRYNYLRGNLQEIKVRYERKDWDAGPFCPEFQASSFSSET